MPIPLSGWLRLPILALSLALILCCVANAAEISGRVVAIADGDTITILAMSSTESGSPEWTHREEAALRERLEAEPLGNGRGPRGDSGNREVRPLLAAKVRSRTTYSCLRRHWRALWVRSLLARPRRKLAQDPDQLGVRRRALLADDLDRIGLGQPVEPREQADTLAPCELGLGRMPAQEQSGSSPSPNSVLSSWAVT